LEEDLDRDGQASSMTLHPSRRELDSTVSPSSNHPFPDDPMTLHPLRRELDSGVVGDTGGRVQKKNKKKRSSPSGKHQDNYLRRQRRRRRSVQRQQDPPSPPGTWTPSQWADNEYEFYSDTETQ
jgi:hypothetical protein